MLDEKDLEKIKELFTEGIEQLVLPQFDAIFKRLDAVEKRLEKVEVRLDRVETRLESVEVRLDKVEEQLSFLTAEMKIVKEYIPLHQEKLEELGDRVKVLEGGISKNSH